MNRFERILQEMDKQGNTPHQGLDEMLSALMSGLREKLNEKGNVKVTIEGFAEQPVILEGVNEFVLFTRTGIEADFKSRASIRFRKAAIAQIKESIIENL